MIGLKESTSVTSLYREFSLSLSKALGCKRVHDDRFTGVTFEENASCNALIVNKEYVWVGNPFSAPKQKGEPLKGSPFCFVCRCMRDSAHVISKHLSQGSGVSAKIRGITRAQREYESRFLLQRGPERNPERKQKAASISGLHRDLFCPDRKQVTIKLYFADLHHLLRSIVVLLSGVLFAPYCP